MRSTYWRGCRRAWCCLVLAVTPVVGCVDQLIGLGPGCRTHRDGVLVRSVVVTDPIRGTDLAEFQFYGWKQRSLDAGCPAGGRDSTWVNIEVKNRSALPVSFDYELTTEVACYPASGSTPRLDAGATWSAGICEYTWPDAGAHGLTVSVAVSNVAYGLARGSGR